MHNKSSTFKYEILILLSLGDWSQWEGGGDEERVWEGEYSANTAYTCMQMEK
jgi:hypothetical protein